MSPVYVTMDVVSTSVMLSSNITLYVIHCTVVLQRLIATWCVYILQGEGFERALCGICDEG